jgi:energy-converting hydrogenase B subunit D
VIDVLQLIVMLMVAILGAAVVLTRDPLPQAIVFNLFGFSLITLFLILQAPDVSLSAIVVGALAYPLLTMATLAKTRDRAR